MDKTSDLYDLYVNQKFSTREIAALLGVNQTTVARRLARAGIPARPKTENKMPTPKGGHHSWGEKISATNKGNPKVGKGNKGKMGSDAPNWRGGVYTDPDGRVFIKNLDRPGYTKRAHLVWLEAHPGETIGKGYAIHHINRDRADDRPENLQRLTIFDHTREHGKDRHKVAAPVISQQGRVGRPARGESRRPTKDELEATYVEQGLVNAARTFGVSRQTILNWLDSYQIPRQGRTAESEARRKAAVAASWS